MPDPKRYTVRDPETGRTITFAWSGDAPPTDDEIGEVFAAAPRTEEPPLTLERRAPGTPSGSEQMALWNSIANAETPSDSAFLKRGSEVGGAAGMVLGGPLVAGAGAALGSLVKGQQAQGAHMPTRGEVGGAAVDGGFSALLAGGVPRVIQGAARAVGPTIAKHAAPISRGIKDLAGVAGGALSGNVLTGMGSATASKVLSPRVIKAAGNAATRMGAAPAHATNKAGFGLLSADAYRKALLDALASEQP